VVELRPNSEEIGPSRQIKDKVVVQASGSTRKKYKVKAPCFGGSLNLEYLLDWVGDMEKYFEWEEIEDPVE